ncbi:MAG: GxxExxY protein [Candidatus Sumerlaeia bacterium]|nr:GxxExxY protein [Candidatus Sumerlaeia bacterium]
MSKFSELTIFQLCDIVRETSYEIHRWFGNGHLEKVYENALVNRLKKQGLDTAHQFPLSVYDEDGTLVGDYFADVIVENRLIVELKACKTLSEEHKAQVIGYLRASKMEHGLLINFGAEKFQIKKFVMSRSDVNEKE